MNNQNAPKRSLKINNQASIIQKPAPKPIEELDGKASDAMKRNGQYMDRFADLSVRFKASMNETILPENRTSIQRDIENDLSMKLLQLASEIDNDVDQPNAEGSRGLIALLMKFMLIQRDRINSMSYQIYGLEKKLFDLTKTKE